jgi:hypothetical protein
MSSLSCGNKGFKSQCNSGADQILTCGGGHLLH